MLDHNVVDMEQIFMSAQTKLYIASYTSKISHAQTFKQSERKNIM